ncbi:putative uncharacterized protein [Roseburia sp. CAG:309]|nr:putative uncharacterized protein [Roseburia sp. CAG:309]
MAVKSGFYNSVEGDRTYNSNDMNAIYAGVRTDGVVEGELNEFKVVAGAGMSVDVTPGLAIIRNKWCKNSAAVNLSLDTGGTLARIDGVFLKADDTERQIVPIVVKGTESSAPVPPAPSNNLNTKYLPIAYVTVPAGATSGGFTIENLKSYSGINAAPRVVLWENSNPDLEFGEEEVNLSESIDLFEDVCIETKDGEVMYGRKGQFSKIKMETKLDTTIRKVMWIEMFLYTRDYEVVDNKASFSHQKKVGLTFEKSLSETSSSFDQIDGKGNNTHNVYFTPLRVYGINRK